MSKKCIDPVVSEILSKVHPTLNKRGEPSKGRNTGKNSPEASLGRGVYGGTHDQGDSDSAGNDGGGGTGSSSGAGGTGGGGSSGKGGEAQGSR